MPDKTSFIEKINKEMPHYSIKHTVKPGLTGWAQLKCIYGESIRDEKEKLQHDTFSIKHLSLRIYFRTIWLTLKMLLTKLR